MMGDLEAGLLEWSKRLALWQRDLLRRLSIGEAMGQDDLRAYASAAERIELVKDSPWYTPPQLGSVPNFAPLDETHLTATQQGGDPVRLTEILHVHDVNGLAPGAKLDLNPTGLTIIAGKNGSGKSGYTRILKQVAVTRAMEPVLPNAFGVSDTPKAVVAYQVGGDAAHELTWEAGDGRSQSPLQRVRIFDAGAANVQLAGSTTVAYVPAALQVLTDYARTLKQIEEVIDADLQELALQERSWPDLETGIGATILSRLGQVDALTSIQSVKVLTPEEETERLAIPAKLSDLAAANPAARAVQAKQRSTQLTTLARNLETIAAKVSPESIAISKNLIASIAKAQRDATNAQRLVQVEGALPGTGDQEWQALWEAAKAFVEADHQHQFPDTSNDEAVCPLCQQPLGETARARFIRFSEFMSGEAQAALVAARTLRNADIDALNALPLDSLVTQDLVAWISTYDGAVGGSLPQVIGDATSIRDFLLGPDNDEPTEASPTALAETLAAGIEALRKAAAAETAAAEVLAATDGSATAAAQLEARRQELIVRKGLATNLAAIAAQHDREIRITRLKTCKEACNTGAASRKNSDLSSSYVAKVCQKFEREAHRLGVDRVPVELVFDRSTRGVSYIKVTLKGAPQVPVASVLSEGEQRVTAIAGFFADLTESGDLSTLVFDDPVSSLDQLYRVKVAQRLLEEAESRQVLVFTHDFSFVQYLYEEKVNRDTQARARSQEPAPGINYLHIERSAAGTGVKTTAEEWRHVSVKERIGRIKNRIQAAGVLYNTNDLVAYEAQARDIVGAIRDTWEVFVEQDLLNSVVTRHDRRVQTQRLEKLIDLSDADVATVDLGMRIDSRFMTGHAAPASDASSAMSPNELNAEVKRLEDLRLEVIRRRR